MNRDNETQNGLGIAGIVGTGLLSIFGGLARHADDVGRAAFRHADDFGRIGMHQVDDIGHAATFNVDDLVHQLDDGVRFRPFVETTDDSFRVFATDGDIETVVRHSDSSVEVLPARATRDILTEVVELAVEIEDQNDD
jgi:hypothetical protein